MRPLIKQQLWASSNQVEPQQPRQPAPHFLVNQPASAIQDSSREAGWQADLTRCLYCILHQSANIEDIQAAAGWKQSQAAAARGGWPVQGLVLHSAKLA